MFHAMYPGSQRLGQYSLVISLCRTRLMSRGDARNADTNQSRKKEIQHSDTYESKITDIGNNSLKIREILSISSKKEGPAYR